jgi:hypothetical protein
MGLNEAINVTEIFCQDRQVRVKIPGCFTAGEVINQGEPQEPLSDDVISAVLGEELPFASKDNKDLPINSEEMSVEERRQQIKDCKYFVCFLLVFIS